MASYTLRQTSTPIHASFSSVDDSIAVVSSNGLVRVWYLDTRLPDPKAGSRFRGGGRVAKPELRWELNLAPTASSVAKQVALGRDGQVAVLFWTDGPHAAGMVVEADSKRKCKNISLTGDVERLLWSHKGWLSLDASGTLRPSELNDSLRRIANLESVDANDGEGVALCPHPRALALSDDSSLVFALSSSGKLHFASMSLNTSQDSNILASSVSSFTLTTDFLIYTTSSQNSQYVPLSDLIRIADGDDKTAFEKDWDGRRVERGALCVVACPSSMSLVLQMPRGNLETIYPRPLVLAVVRRDVLACAVLRSVSGKELIVRKWQIPLSFHHVSKASAGPEYPLRPRPGESHGKIA